MQNLIWMLIVYEHFKITQLCCHIWWMKIFKSIEHFLKSNNWTSRESVNTFFHLWLILFPQPYLNLPINAFISIPQVLELDRYSDPWSSAMPEIHPWSSSSSHTPFWALPCPRPWVSSVLWWLSCCCLPSKPLKPTSSITNYR